jgi:hypothetical protein
LARGRLRASLSEKVGPVPEQTMRELEDDVLRWSAGADAKRDDEGRPNLLAAIGRLSARAHAELTLRTHELTVATGELRETTERLDRRTRELHRATRVLIGATTLLALATVFNFLVELGVLHARR